MDYYFYIILFSLIFLVSILLLNLPKIILFFKNRTRKRKNRKLKKQKENSRVIYKSSQAQLRPVVKPPEIKYEEKNKDENKEVEIEEEIDDFDEKSAKTGVVNIDKNIEGEVFDPSQIRLLNKPDRAKAISDLDKEFEEIRKFLEIPNEKSSTPAKKFSDFVVNPNKGKRTKNYDEIDYNDYIMGNEKSTSGNKKAVNKDNSFIQKSKTGNNHSFVEIDGEKIDLNKLPTNLKKILISNVLSRKNFDD